MDDYVGRWDCEKCSTQVWGILRHCPNCGANTTGKYYLPDGEPPSTLEEVKRIVQAGPNWTCNHCQSDNYGDTGFCTECGAGKGMSPDRQIKEYGLDDVPSSADEVREVEYTIPSYNHPASSQRSFEPPGQPAESLYEVKYSFEPTRVKSRRDFRWLLFPAGIVAIVAVIAFIYLAIRPYNVATKIDRFQWGNIINVGQYLTRREGDWSIPAGGRQVSSESRVHHYRQVFSHNESKTRQVYDGTEEYACGRTDNGNGTFSDRYCSRTKYREETYQEAVYRDEPVYQTWYHYDIDRWGPSRNVVNSGQSRTDPKPFWLDPNLACANQAIIGCEREESRREHFYVVFTWMDGEDRKEHRLEEERADWDAYDAQAEYVLVFNGLGTLLNDPLRPEKTE